MDFSLIAFLYRFLFTSKMLSLKVLMLLLVQRLVMAYDLCIIGAGMFGSAAARHASANPEIKVCLIGPTEPKGYERQNREIFASYYDAGRQTRVLGDDPAYAVLGRESIKRFGELEEMSGIKFHTPVGFLYIVRKTGNTLKKLLQAVDAKNVPAFELPRETFQKRYPYLRLKEDETALLDDNGAGHFDPRKMVEAQKKIAKLQGCDIIDSVVSRITLENGCYKIKTENNFTITAKRIIVATGSFINTKIVGVLKPLKVTKLKTTASLVKIPAGEVKRLSSLPDLMYNGSPHEIFKEEINSYILPPIRYPDGNYYIKTGIQGHEKEAFTLDEIRKWYLSDGDTNIAHRANYLLTKMLPGIQFTDKKTMTCVYCMTPTGLPYIDRISPTLTVAVGGNGGGAKVSDEVGRLAAQLSVTGNWDSELRKDRFQAVFQE